MKTKLVIRTGQLLGLALLFSTLNAQRSTLLAQGTAFTYQGRLQQNGAPANGSYDLQSTLYDIASGGASVAGPITNVAATISNGLFTATLDFGPGLFVGTNRWLEISVRTNGAGPFVLLNPRQPLTPAPYAIYAANVSASGIAGSIPDNQLSGNIARLNGNQTFSGTVSFSGVLNNFSGSFTGNGAGVTNVSVSSLNVTKTNTSVVGWGYNGYGQATAPASLSNVLAVAVAVQHSVALRSDGTVVAWGDNSRGQTNVPFGLSNVVAIAAGALHSLALRSNGTVAAWGLNADGQINVPASLNNAMAVAAGYFHSVALKNDGTVIAWGNGVAGQTNIPAALNGVMAVAAGALHSLALKTNGTVVAWGDNTYGQTNTPPGLSNVTAVAAGYWHNIALKSDGTVIAWGQNTYGQANVPLGLNSVLAVAAGFAHSLALKSDGTVVAWGGSNGFGQTNVPLGLNHVIAIAPGCTSDHALAIQNQAVSPVALLNENNTFNGNVGVNGVLFGNGAGLTNLSADSIGGTLADARLSANVALLNRNGQAFTGDNSFGGSVGIGTATPAAKLHVYSPASPTTLRLQSAGTPGFGRIEFFSNPQGDLNEWRPGYIESLDTGGFTGGLGFYVNGTGGANGLGSIEVMRLINGNVGIGTNNPTVKLEVAGTVKATAFSGTFAGNGGGLTNLNAATLGGLNSSSFWKLGGNAGTTAGVNYLGTTDNQPLELKVNGVRALRLENAFGAPNVIGGSPNNLVSPGITGATIGGGDHNTNTGSYATVGGGYYNTISANYATVGGGWQNISSGSYATAGGGLQNSSSGSGGTVGGGWNNTNSGSYATVAGGWSNNASGITATIGGGFGNISSGDYTTVGGGLGNISSGYYATVPGGADNFAGGYCSFAAGFLARATHDGSFVWADFSELAGVSTTADNQFLIRAIGGVGIGTANPLAQLAVDGNTRIDARGGAYSEGLVLNCPADMSAPGGYGGIVFHNATRGGALSGGTVKWGAQYNYAPEIGVAAGGLAFIQNNATTRLYLGTNGNVGIGTTSPTNKLHVVGGGATFTSGNINLNQAVVWAPGNASWSFTSDRNTKERLSPVDQGGLLEKVCGLRITEWSYIGYEQRHIGPMAQDFHAAFPLNETDTSLNDADLHGVALAAIQGLNQKLEQEVAQEKTEITELRKELIELKTQTLAQKETEITELKQRLEKLERLMSAQK
jgi:hypothetical protein